MKELINSARVRFLAVSENESFARTLTAGFLMHLRVTPSQLADIKTALIALPFTILGSMGATRLILRLDSQVVKLN